MITINEIEEILIHWTKDIKPVAKCTIVGKEPLDRKAPHRTPCDGCDLNWLFLVDGNQWFNFGVNAVDEEGIDPIAELHAAKLTFPEDVEDWEQPLDPDTLEPVLDERWNCWTIPLTERKELERELSILRWNLELNEPDKSLDPRPFMITQDDAMVLRLLAEFIKRLADSFPTDSKEQKSLECVMGFLESAPDTKRPPDYKEFWIWDPAVRLSGVIGYKMRSQPRWRLE